MHLRFLAIGLLASLLGCGGKTHTKPAADQSNDGTNNDSNPPPPPTNQAPVADAGSYTYVPHGGALDASGSSDPDGDGLTYSWSETSGYGVTFTNNDSSDPKATTITYAWPEGVAVIDVEVQLTVTDPKDAQSQATATLRLYRTDYAYAAVGGEGDGSAPATPADGLTAAITFAQSNARVAVAAAEGTYLVNAAGGTEVILVNGISLYGGYATTDWQRDPAAFVSTIQDTSASGGTGPGAEANSAVVADQSIGAGTVLDGFTIIAGGGFYANAVLLQGAAATVRGNILSGGSTSAFGGMGLFCFSCDATVIRNHIADATIGIYVQGSSTAVIIGSNEIVAHDAGVTVGYSAATRVLVANNTIEGSGTTSVAVQLKTAAPADAPTGVEVLNNIFYVGGVCLVEDDTTTDFARVQNNAFFCEGGYLYFDADRGCNGNGIQGDAEDKECGLADMEALPDIAVGGNIEREADFVDQQNGDRHLPATTAVELLQGGLDLAVEGEPLSLDADGIARTNLTDGPNDSPTNIGAAGWSMGAYEQDARIEVVFASGPDVANGGGLDATGSVQIDGLPMTFHWSELSDLGLTFADNDGSTPTGTTVSYSGWAEHQAVVSARIALTVSDGSDSVTVEKTLLIYRPQYAFVAPGGSGSGASPSSPTGDITAAIAFASGDGRSAVAVQEGTYGITLTHVSGTGIWDGQVKMLPGVSVFGGYGRSTWARDIAAHRTIIQDISPSGGTSLSDANAPVRFDNSPGGAFTPQDILDGFEIVAGTGTFAEVIHVGAAHSPTISNNLIDCGTQADYPYGLYDRGAAHIRNNFFIGRTGEPLVVYGSKAAAVIENNVIVSGDPGIEVLWTQTKTVVIRNNTIVSAEIFARGIRLAGTGTGASTGALVENNIIDLTGDSTTCLSEGTADVAFGSVRNNALVGCSVVLYDYAGACDSDAMTNSEDKDCTLEQMETVTATPSSGNVGGATLTYADAPAADYRLDAGTPADVTQGGLDGAAEGWDFSTDADGKTRTDLTAGPNGSPSNANAGGWSMGAYELDAR